MAASLDTTTKLMFEAEVVSQTEHDRWAASVASNKFMLEAEVASQSEHNRWDKTWEEIVNDHQGKEPYKRAAALLISWDQSDLDIKGKLSAEIRDLSAMFENQYRFKVVPAVLKSKTPVLELNAHLSKFLFEHNDPNGLLLIYYAGHGQSLLNQNSASGGNSRHPNNFQLMRNSQLNYQRDMQHNSLVWDEVESQISKVDNDILAIFDCCEAGSLCNVRKPTRYEYLGACGDTQRARGPGEKSFTTALTWALGELVSEQFNTVDLLTKIKAAPSFQHGQLPRLAPRGEWRSSITLAPLPPDDQRARDNEQVRPTPPFHVDLRFHFDCLDYDAFTKLAKEMKEIKRVIDAQRISFLGQHSIYERIREHVVHWVSVTKSERRRNKMEQQQEHREMELAKMYGMKWLNVHRNRKQAQVDHLDEDIDKVDLSVDANNMDGQASNQDSTSHHTQPEPKRPGKRRRQAEPLQHAKRRRQAKRVPVTPTPTDDSLGGTDSERK